MIRRVLGLRIPIVIVIIVTVSSAHAQTNVTTGLVLGGVVDGDGRALAGAIVEARSPSTGLTRRTFTDADGRYRIDLLPPTLYEVDAGLSGYRTELQRGVPVGLGARVAVDFILSPSVIEDELVVTATVPMVETTDPTVGTTVGDWAIANLPLRRRNFTDLVLLTPGTSTDRLEETPGGRGSAFIGARQVQVSYNIDGGTDDSAFFGRQRGGTQPPFTFSQAAIAEFQVLKTGYGLQYSSGGGVINAITKSGTNVFRGEVFAYYTNTDMVSEDGLGRKEDWDQKQYGFALGGPIVLDRLHFFTSLDNQDWLVPHHTVFEDFPAGREADWEALTGLDYETETSSYPTTNDALAMLIKLDWQLAGSHLLTARYNRSDAEAKNQAQPIQDETNGLSINGTRFATIDSLVVSLNSMLSDSVVNEAFLQYAMENRPETANSTDLPSTEIYRWRAWWGQGARLPNTLNEESIQLVDTVRFFLGKHTLKTGANLLFVSFDDVYCPACNGIYEFDDWEGDDGFLDEGTPYSFTQAFSATDGTVTFDGGSHSVFAEDEWRVAPGLTLSYGLRYEIQRHDQPVVTNPLWPDTGRIPDDTDNWSLRAGFAWDPAGDGKQVLRGGLGRYYDTTPTLLDADAMLFNGVTGVQVFQLCWYGDPCPTYPDVWDSIGDIEGLDPTIFVFDPTFENPETNRFSLGYERDLSRDLSLGVDLIYSETRKLGRKQDQNIIPSDGSTTPDGRPLYGGHGLNSNFDQIIEFTSDARARYTAVVLRAHKRFSGGWFLDASYTWSDARDNDSSERSVRTSAHFPEDQFNLDNDWGPSDFDVRHKLVASLVWQLPLNLQLGVIGVYRSGFPYSGLDRRDNNHDSYHNERALIETSPGVWVHYDRNTERQPDVKNIDLRLSWTARLGKGLNLELMGEVFNLTNEANWYVSFGRQVLVFGNGTINDEFGEPNRVGAPRRFQVGARLRF